MSSYQILIPSTVLYGAGSIEQLGNKVKPMGSKALIVSDKVMTDSGNVEKIQNILIQQDIGFEVYNEVNGEPTDVMIEKGLNIYKNGNCDFLVGIGGGSPIDAAKAIGLMANNPGNIVDYMGSGKVKNPLPPVVAIATTSGTGSEVTQFTIIADTKNDVKMLIGSPYIVPKLAVNDPLFTMSVPAKTTAATGIDAFTHAIEAYISKKSHPFTETMSLSAISRISKYIRRAWANGDDIEARSQMMIASMEAGIAFSNASVTIVHGMSRPIGAVFHIAHGISNAVLLPKCMEFALMGAPEKFAKVAEAMGENIEGLTTMEAAKKAVEAIKQLNDDLEIPSISGLGIDKEKFLAVASKMAQDALNSGSPANTPRKVSLEQIVQIYKDSL
ncbi:MAG: iron-containing alcohol dehydrogenase [Sedimentibacter sp.]